MGEYAIRKSDGVEIKIGTCGSMYYLRYEDRNKVKKIEHSLDANSEKNLFWRLPFPDEDEIMPGEYRDHSRGERLYEGNDFFSDKSTIEDPGTIQIHHESGLLVNLPCYHGEKLPEDVKAFWNGKSWFFELAHIKNTEDQGIVPVVRCRFCGQMWRYSWEEILPYLHGEMKSRLEKYAIKKAA